MIVSINQPAYLPWLGYFDRIAASDLHVVLDHVQFEKNSFVNRNKVRTKTGWTWLTIPLATRGKFGALPINQIQVADGGRWRRKNWATLQSNYRRAPYFEMFAPSLAKQYESAVIVDAFLPFVMEQNAEFMAALNIDTEIRRSSEMLARSTKSDLVLDICIEAGATRYLSGPLGRNYLEEEKFDKAGIEIAYHDYSHPVYEQIHPGFEPFMAIIDLLFNCGERSGEILRSPA